MLSTFVGSDTSNLTRQAAAATIGNKSAAQSGPSLIFVRLGIRLIILYLVDHSGSEGVSDAGPHFARLDTGLVHVAGWSHSIDRPVRTTIIRAHVQIEYGRQGWCDLLVRKNLCREQWRCAQNGSFKRGFAFATQRSRQITAWSSQYDFVLQWLSKFPRLESP